MDKFAILFICVLQFATSQGAVHKFSIRDWIMSPRIHGGQEISDITQIPHYVTLGIYPTTENETYCGGSLLSSQFVLTAAACFNNVTASNYVVIIYFGANDLDKATTVRLASKVNIHPKWNNKTLENNLAILKFRAVPLTQQIRPIRLPSKAQENQSFFNSKATVSGRGQSSNDDKLEKGILRSVGTNVVANIYCRTRYLFSTISDTNICTSYFGSEGICKGDEGGPLSISESDTQDTLIGVASFKGSNCEASIPSVFTRVTSYLVWISGVTSIPIRE